METQRQEQGCHRKTLCGFLWSQEISGYFTATKYGDSWFQFKTFCYNAENWESCHYSCWHAHTWIIFSKIYNHHYIWHMTLIGSPNGLEIQPIRPMRGCSTASSVAQGISHAICPGVLRPRGGTQIERARETSAARSRPFSFGNLSAWFRTGKPWVVSPSEPSKCLQLFEAKQTASNPSWMAAIHARTAMMRISHDGERLGIILTNLHVQTYSIASYMIRFCRKKKGLGKNPYWTRTKPIFYPYQPLKFRWETWFYRKNLVFPNPYWTHTKPIFYPY